MTVCVERLLVLLCHCHRVNDAAVEAVLAAGATKVGQLVRATRAGTDCGSCLPALRGACARAMAERLAPQAELSRVG